MEMTLVKAEALGKHQEPRKCALSLGRWERMRKGLKLSPQLPGIKGRPGKTQAGLQDSTTGSLQDRSFNNNAKL